MFRLTVLILIMMLAACGEPRSASSPSSERPMRIVSLDYCADQYVLKFADPEQILAISPDGVKDFSFMRDTAADVPTVRAVAEDVLILKPDLVVRSYGGGPNAAAFFERAGIPVLQVGWASTVEGDGPGSIAHLVQTMADGLGQSDKGAQTIADYQARLAALNANPSGISTLYMSRAGVSTGEGTLAHNMMVAAGLENYADRAGWHSLPLEKIAYEKPEMVAATFFDTPADPRYRWSASRHPIAQSQLERTNTVSLEGAWTSCGGWYILNAVEALSEGAAND